MFEGWGSGEYAFVGFVFVQFGGVVAMLATMRQKIKDQDARIKVIEDHDIGGNLAAIKTKLEYIKERLDGQGVAK